jgi:hypothetical protein
MSDLARVIGNSAPDAWYYHVKPERGEPFEASGFADELSAMAAAEAYAMERHGPAPTYRVALCVGRESKMLPAYLLEWPPRARNEE